MNEPRFNGISSNVLRPRLVCLGYIKIGGRAEKKATSVNDKEFQPPVKYDHFRIRTRVRGDDGNYKLDEAIHQKIGTRPTELSVRFRWPEPEQNFITRLAAYEGRQLRCEGNGERAFDRVLDKEIQCTCPLLKQHKGDYPLKTYPRPVGKVACKPSGTLTCMIEQAPFYGGYYLFRTTSWETISVLTAALNEFKAMFGRVDWIPFRLIVYPHTVTYDGNKTSTAYGVSLVLPGGMQSAYQIAASAQQEREKSIALLNAGVTPEEQAAQVAEIEKEDAAEIAAEFHPETAASDVGGPDYETVAEDEPDEAERALEARIRRALEMAKVEPEKINRSIASYSDRMQALADYIEKERPNEWKQAGHEMELAAAAAEIAPSPLGSGAEPLNLFGDA